MCSINGFNFRNEELIRKMVKITKHRGPDDEGFWCDENVSLGHARLSIVDLSEKGRQPLWNEDRTVAVVCNGEIYNFPELRKELISKGHRFFSVSDSEVIVHLYEEKEEECLEQLNGIFAFCLYDKPKNKILLARDRVGVKPLYYFFDGNHLIFSSEIKGILTHPVKREIDPQSFLHHFQLSFVPSPLTLLKNIKKLPPAHYLVYQNKNIFIKKYWDIQDLPEIASIHDIKERIKAMMRDIVKSQLISDRPVGIFLSGGIDSSSVLGVAGEFIPGKIKTYSVGFDIQLQHEKFNQDFYLARKTSEYYQTDHHELLVSDIDARDNLEKVIWHMEEPAPNPTQIATFLLAREAKKEVAVVLGGDGGDEIFGGYPRYYYSQLIDYYQTLPLFLRENILPYFLELIFKKKSLREKLNTPPGVERYLLFMGQKTEILSQVLQQPLSDALTENFLKKQYPENRFKDHGKYLMYLDLFTWLPDESLLRSDKMTMAFGLEERVPILDHRLVELAFRIPTKYKIRGTKSWKWIFKEAVKEYIPDHLWGREKRGWFSPGAKWLRGALKEVAYDALSPSFCYGAKEYFNFQNLKNILDDHISGKVYNSDIIWSVLMFQVWYKTFIENERL